MSIAFTIRIEDPRRAFRATDIELYEQRILDMNIERSVDLVARDVDLETLRLFEKYNIELPARLRSLANYLDNRKMAS